MRYLNIILIAIAVISSTSAAPAAFLKDRCGPGEGECDPGHCCSQYGWCVTFKDHCGKGCQSEFGVCENNSTSKTTKTKTTKIKTTKTKTTKTTKTSKLTVLNQQLIHHQLNRKINMVRTVDNGLVQWTSKKRKTKLFNYAREHSKSIGDLQMQLDFLWLELQDKKYDNERAKYGKISKNEIFIPNNEMREIFEIFIQSKNYQNLNKKIKNSKNICVTRPRPFGKTVTVNMIKAYYSFSESKITVFDDKRISEIKNWDKYL
ncbi:carbohydrate-binding module family 18 protein [Piromyces sp. E2]|nr:carbohydrate-binding module family 18 protein [Piromyces sp. E2]|eukprot:OUM58177.1 carbohydrate-binding module family 18 protein [Piromyces sp. E2]